MAYMFYHGYAEKLRVFAKNGGTLVISYWSGLVDETDKCYLEGTPHGLMEAAGIRAEEIDALYDWKKKRRYPGNRKSSQNYRKLYLQKSL